MLLESSFPFYHEYSNNAIPLLVLLVSPFHSAEHAETQKNKYHSGTSDVNVWDFQPDIIEKIMEHNKGNLMYTLSSSLLQRN